MMETRPVAAYTLAMVGVALQGVALFFLVYMFASISSFSGGFPSHGPWMMGLWMMGYPYGFDSGWSVVWIVSALVIVGLGVYGTVLMNSSNLARVRMGSTLVLITSIIAFPTMWGFMIGSLLMFVGSLLGLTWVPPRTQTT